jgi:hypothetical protein
LCKFASPGAKGSRYRRLQVQSLYFAQNGIWHLCAVQDGAVALERYVHFERKAVPEEMYEECARVRVRANLLRLSCIGWWLDGWDRPDPHQHESSVKNKIATLLYGVRMILQIPLIWVNLAVIVFELLLG